jgi:phosphohistidine phosphatase SixA
MFRYLFVLLTIILPSINPVFVMADTNSMSLRDAIDEIDANVIFMRHALAPGYGDPDDFDINQCDTQRNLDDTGRAQAQFIGQHLKTEQLIFTDILSSQWCRCKETASELGLGDWRSFAGLNSFFQDHADRTETLTLLSEKIDTIKENELVLMVTHQVVISAVTGHSTRSGGLILYNTASGKTLPFSIKDL